jgi:hypothetical protein
MFEQRKNVRYPTLARACVPAAYDGEALLKDLNVTGCCVEYTIFVDIKPDALYKIVILPDSVSNIEKFELEVICRWIRTAEYSCEIGFSVAASPKGKAFQRYVDYLTWRSANVP